MENLKFINALAKNLNIKELNLESATNKIIELGNVENIYYFAQKIKGANIDKLTDSICRRKAEDIYSFGMKIILKNEQKEKILSSLKPLNKLMYNNLIIIH